MTSDQTKKLKKQLAESETKDFKIAWQHLSWEWKIFLVVGMIILALTIIKISFRFGQWLVDYFIL